MIDRQQAEQLAAVWARRDSQRLGHECRASVDEFDLGYVISSTVSPDVRTVPGDLPTTVVDKWTGEVSTWPRVSLEQVERMYRRSRPAGQPAPRTVDPASQLLREIRRLPTPTTAAHLNLDGRLHRAQGAKGDIELHHHPLVRRYLDDLPPGHLVRGGDRHAELIVVSDVLHEYDHRRAAEGIEPMSMADAESLLGKARFEVFHVREAGDRYGGRIERGCDSCVNFLVHFNLLPWAELAFTAERRIGPQPPIQPGRFPSEVADSLVEGGWEDTMFNAALAAGAIRETCEHVSQVNRHEPFPAAEQALTAFPAIVSERRGAGEQVWISGFTTNPLHSAQTADTLADFAEVLGHRLFPFGSEFGESIIAVDERGRIFALDQAGEWFLGADVDAALITLLLGRAPARVRDDGTW
ncbi:SUKH-3 domain-containing protein [Micromonospora endolithica]|uniref:YwqJ-like deaminase n=1 Tax=Micromonospora endolithica TaxID=230091 RepID=A0A3A9YS76_9ACTN|nr:SUKH-3 domain-containing protein [Micromonospora endolithica]RKN38096.1 hypothetical protein D7223_31665 [Micromonospora endolithica]TWJ23880.1 YwqJ-like deaminase [Micromonospora endolithica]